MNRFFELDSFYYLVSDLKFNKTTNSQNTTLVRNSIYFKVFLTNPSRIFELIEQIIIDYQLFIHYLVK